VRRRPNLLATEAATFLVLLTAIFLVCLYARQRHHMGELPEWLGQMFLALTWPGRYFVNFFMIGRSYEAVNATCLAIDWLSYFLIFRCLTSLFWFRSSQRTGKGLQS
jgi:hypothetical protein